MKQYAENFTAAAKEPVTAWLYGLAFVEGRAHPPYPLSLACASTGQTRAQSARGLSGQGSGSVPPVPPTQAGEGATVMPDRHRQGSPCSLPEPGKAMTLHVMLGWHIASSESSASGKQGQTFRAMSGVLCFFNISIALTTPCEGGLHLEAGKQKGSEMIEKQKWSSPPAKPLHELEPVCRSTSVPAQRDQPSQAEQSEPLQWG